MSRNIGLIAIRLIVTESGVPVLYPLIVVGAIIAVLAASIPILAIALVSLASLHEESAHTLGDAAPGPGERLARRILGFRGSPAPPVSRRSAVSRPPASVRSAGPEVRFPHARRPVSDSGQHPASRQPSPHGTRSDQRERAGV